MGERGLDCYEKIKSSYLLLSHPVGYCGTHCNNKCCFPSSSVVVGLDDSFTDPDTKQHHYEITYSVGLCFYFWQVYEARVLPQFTLF